MSTTLLTNCIKCKVITVKEKWTRITDVISRSYSTGFKEYSEEVGLISLLSTRCFEECAI